MNNFKKKDRKNLKYQSRFDIVQNSVLEPCVGLLLGPVVGGGYLVVAPRWIYE